MVGAILTDIEGTTSSISFVKDVLFPYARERLAGFVADHGDEAAVKRELDAVRESEGAALTDSAVAELLCQWIDEDRKATPLKALQGLIWRAGYERGDYRAHVYTDAVDGLRRWHEQGISIYVYSSGSVLAQKLFFAHTGFGDLTPLFNGYFDTTTGPKTAADSYRRIADEMSLAPQQVLFLSDVGAELDAAKSAGMATCLVVRDEDGTVRGAHPTVHSFAEVQPV